MLGRRALGLLFFALIAPPAMAEPPADLDACLKLATDVAKSAGAKIKTEAAYAQFYKRQLSLNSACGTNDFAGAEKIANDIRAEFQLD